MIYKLYLMPEEKVKGSHDKWIEHSTVESTSRRKALRKIHDYPEEKNKQGKWPPRKEKFKHWKLVADGI